MGLAFQKCLARLSARRVYDREKFSERLENRWLGAYLGEQADVPAGRRLRPLILASVLPKDRNPIIESWHQRERSDVVLSPLGTGFRIGREW